MTVESQMNTPDSSSTAFTQTANFAQRSESSAVKIMGIDGEKLTFELNEKEITLENTSDSNIIFKFLLTFSNYYEILPSMGSILKGKTRKVLIRLKAELPHLRTTFNDRFQIRILKCDDRNILTNSSRWEDEFKKQEFEKIVLQTVFIGSSVRSSLEDQENLLQILRSDNSKLKESLAAHSQDNMKLKADILALNKSLKAPPAVEFQKQQEYFNQFKNEEDFDLVSIFRSTINNYKDYESVVGKYMLICFVVGVLVGKIIF